MLSLVLIHGALGGLVACRLKVFALVPILVAAGVMTVLLLGLSASALWTVAMTSVAMQVGYLMSALAQTITVRELRTRSADLLGPKRV